MSLQRRLDEIRSGFEREADPAVVEVMHRATAVLVASGQAQEAVGEGDLAPDFDLVNTDGGRVRLTDLRERRPVVLTFFRGHW